MCRSGTLLVTCGKDGTMRIWSADWGKEISCQFFKSSQLCLCILDDIDVYF
jgi:WD40 repeat protein